MQKNILLLEPNYRNKYPPIGLMKIAYFHRFIQKDHVQFAKGTLSNSSSQRKWDRVYVTSLFTFEYEATIQAINYAKTLVRDPSSIIVGGILATLMPEKIKADTGITPVVGLLNVAGKLSLPDDACVDQLPLDYSILKDISYVYPAHNAYFLSTTKGCGMRCGFCAVQTLEPKYIPYMDIKTKVKIIDETFGSKRDLLLMDNNVLLSKDFDRIIDDILDLGFHRGATFKNPKTGKVSRRYVDFNQGLDAKFLTEHKAKRLGEIALSPARIAFDHIEDEEQYIASIEMCARNNITELSNYILYNSEEFTGKGNRYKADRPEDLYTRMRISLDLRDRLNAERLNDEEKIMIFSFPMRYIPLDATERGYVGSNWNPKYLRSVQCMLIPTQGKGVGSQSFFEADFGNNVEEFKENLCMPERLMLARGHFVENKRGHKKESRQERDERYALWLESQQQINEWKRLFGDLGKERDEFISKIADNEYLPEKIFHLTSELQQKIYLHYLTEPRIVRLLGLVDKTSPIFKTLFNYMTVEFPLLYKKICCVLTLNKPQQHYMIIAFSHFFGRQGISDLLNILLKDDFKADEVLSSWSKAYSPKLKKQAWFDYDLLRYYHRYLDLNCLDDEEIQSARTSILNLDSDQLRCILQAKYPVFAVAVEATFSQEVGAKLLKKASANILAYIQLVLFDASERKDSND